MDSIWASRNPGDGSIVITAKKPKTVNGAGFWNVKEKHRIGKVVGSKLLDDLGYDERKKFRLVAIDAAKEG